MRCFKKAYISLGSNLGDRQRLLSEAGKEIEKIPNLRVLRKTSVLENQAILYEEQPDFLNQIFEIETIMFPEELLERLKDIETKMGRTKTFRYGPRMIDLDILSFGRTARSSEDLTLPHEGLYNRMYIRILLEEMSLTPETVFPPSRDELRDALNHAVNCEKLACGNNNG